MTTTYAVSDCDSVAAWSATGTYNSGDKVLYDGSIYVADGTCIQANPEFNAVWIFETECSEGVTTPVIPDPSDVPADCSTAAAWVNEAFY